MERVVVDSNILVKWFIPEEYSEYAVLLRNDHLLGCVEAVAPRYALLEFHNAIRKYYARGVINRGQALRISRLALEASPTLLELEEELLHQAFTYSLEKHVTVYDAYYVALAQSLRAAMYTADEKLLERLRGDPYVKHIKEYKPRCIEPRAHGAPRTAQRAAAP